MHIDRKRTTPAPLGRRSRVAVVGGSLTAEPARRPGASEPVIEHVCPDETTRAPVHHVGGETPLSWSLTAVSSTARCAFSRTVIHVFVILNFFGKTYRYSIDKMNATIEFYVFKYP